MAGLKKKPTPTEEVAKFGGIEEIGSASLGGYTHDVQSLEVESKTKLEHDEGHGNPAIIRCFEFGINPVAFSDYQPTRQELFNHHAKGIEVALWKDGLQILLDVAPRMIMDQKKMIYKIFVAARPRKGHLLLQKPSTLKEIAHG